MDQPSSRVKNLFEDWLQFQLEAANASASSIFVRETARQFMSDMLHKNLGSIGIENVESRMTKISPLMARLAVQMARDLEAALSENP